MSSIKPYCKTFHFLNLRLAAGYNLTNSRQSDRRTLKARTTLQLREISQLEHLRLLKTKTSIYIHRYKLFF